MPNSKPDGKDPKKTDKDYVKFIIELAALEKPINPKEAVKRVLEKFPRHEFALPTDKQLSDSFTYQKRKRVTAMKVK